MALLSHNYSFIFIFSFAFILPFITCVPLPENPYDTFIDFLLENNCTMPKEVKIPFQTPSDPSRFNYLLTPLKECRTRDAVKDNDEATLLCKEVFDVLQNITCIEYNKPLSTIESNMSENVCADFRNMQAVFPKRNDYLSNKLVDDIICKIFCTKERYELLCKTLLWSYDIQAKIENVLENEDKETVKADSHEVSGKDAVENQEKKTEKGDNHDVSAKDSLVVANSVVSGNIEPKNQEPSKDTNKPATSGNLHTEKKISSEKPDLNNPEVSDKKSSSELHETTLETTSNKILSSTSKYQMSNVSKVANRSKNENNVPSQDESEIKNQKLSPHSGKVEDSKNLEPKESNSLLNQNVIDDKKNEIDEKHPDKMKETDHVPEVKSDTNTKSLPSNNNNMQDQNVKNVSEDSSKNNVNSDITAKTNSKFEESVVPNPEMDNELNNKNFEESETKPKETDLKAPVDKDKDVNKPELTDFESPNEASPDTDSKLPESSTLQMLPDEDEHQQDDKDQDPYNDTENEGDYAKADYDASFNLSPKSKEPAIKSSIAADSNQPPNNYFISTGNNIGRIPDDIAVIPPFPEQEDSHFFFYFLSIVLILMAGYLIFHNKQKIIALIVEGRHERRRRSHGAGYKKLETK